MRKDKLIAIGKGKPLVLICMLLAISIFASLSVQADSNMVEQRKILPYLEAAGEADASNLRIGWIDMSKIIYQSKLDAKGSAIEHFADKTIIHDDQFERIQLFNIDNKTTEFYKNGHLNGYEDGVATIIISRTIPQNSSVQKSTELLQGSLGNEVTVTKYQAEDIKVKKFCPNDNELITNKKTTFRLLKPEHGCIRAPWPFNNDDRDGVHTYFRADGEKINFTLPVYDQIGFGIWINWLQAYILGDNVTQRGGGRTPGAINTPTIKIFYPTGELKLIDMDEFSLTHARPTRAGMVAAKNRIENGAFLQKVNGLFLWRDGLHYQISEGNVTKTEVSPDGCKIAFYAEHKNVLSRGRTAKLRVIDVCEGFGVARDANPFN